MNFWSFIDLNKINQLSNQQSTLSATISNFPIELSEQFDMNNKPLLPVDKTIELRKEMIGQMNEYIYTILYPIGWVIVVKCLSASLSLIFMIVTAYFGYRVFLNGLWQKLFW